MRRRALLAVLAAALVAGTVLAGCGGDSATDESGAGGLPDGAEDLVGRYAHFDVVAYRDPTMSTGIISTGFSDLELRDGELWNQMTFCHADTVTNQAIEVAISDAATQAITPIATPVEVTRQDGELHVSRPATPTPIGSR
jgi:hypothetical protein